MSGADRELADEGAPSTPAAPTAPTGPALLHDIGVLYELRQWTGVEAVNAFLALGWVLLRVSDGASVPHLVGWRRSLGEPELPSFVEDERREREALLEAVSADGFELE